MLGGEGGGGGLERMGLEGGFQLSFPIYTTLTLIIVSLSLFVWLELAFTLF